MESRKRSSDNCFQADRLLKMSKNTSDYKTLHDTPVFTEKFYFEEESLDIGDKNNILKVSIPTLENISAGEQD